MKINPALQYVEELKESDDTKEIARLLATGEWIAINAIELKNGQYRFVLGRVNCRQEACPR